MYVGDWSNWADVSADFDGVFKRPEKPSIPEPTQVIFAGYEVDGYDGSAFVVYRQGRKFYTVDGGHCSCYGLEGQWKPEEYTKPQLREALKKGGVPYGLERYRPQIIEALGGL